MNLDTYWGTIGLKITSNLERECWEVERVRREGEEIGKEGG